MTEAARTTALETLAPAAPTASPPRSRWRDAAHRFTRNKAAVVGAALLIAIVLFALIGPLFSRFSIESIDWNLMADVAGQGQPAIDNGHYFGIDQVGRDLFARVIQGTQVSLAVGILGTGVAVLLGTFYGAIAGYFGGRIDSVLMRFVDIVYSIPFLFILILMLIIFGRSFTVLFISIGLISWLGMARVVRGQTLTLKHRDFIEAAIATGVKPLAIVVRHIIPNLLGIVVVYATLLVPEIILLESFISFLGLGIQEPSTSLGALISEGSQTMQYGELWQIAFPLFFFVSLLFAFFFVGDGLRDALDPKER